MQNVSVLGGGLFLWEQGVGVGVMGRGRRGCEDVRNEEVICEELIRKEMRKWVCEKSGS